MRGAPLGSTPHFRNIVIMAVYGAILFGLATLSQGGAQAAASSIPVTVVQPNVGQQDKWVGSKADANFATLARLTTPKDDAPRLILWPEAAVPESPAARQARKRLGSGKKG